MNTSHPARATVPTKSRTNAVIVAGVDADAMLDRHRNADGSRIARTQSATSAGSAIRHAPKLPVCTRSRRTAAIEVDLVVAPLLAEPRACASMRGIAAAELQRDRMLGGIEVEMPRHVAVQQRRRGDHLGVEPRARRDQAQEYRQCRSVQSIIGATQKRQWSTD